MTKPLIKQQMQCISSSNHEFLFLFKLSMHICSSFLGFPENLSRFVFTWGSVEHHKWQGDKSDYIHSLIVPSVYPSLPPCGRYPQGSLQSISVLSSNQPYSFPVGSCDLSSQIYKNGHKQHREHTERQMGRSRLCSPEQKSSLDSMGHWLSNWVLLEIKKNIYT